MKKVMLLLVVLLCAGIQIAEAKEVRIKSRTSLYTVDMTDGELASVKNYVILRQKIASRLGISANNVVLHINIGDAHNPKDLQETINNNRFVTVQVK